jgi:pyruvate-ferredoxin/flavodoxin oxidoreductase
MRPRSFLAAGKPTGKKDLGLMAMAYRNAYVATVSMGYSDVQTVRAFIEAEAYDGPSIIIAYSHCIAHGIDMAKGLDHQAAVVDSGAWTLFRFNPSLYAKGENPLKLDSKPPKMTYEQWAMKETRFRSLVQSSPDRAKALMLQGQQEAIARVKLYQALAVTGSASPFAPPALVDEAPKPGT